MRRAPSHPIGVLGHHVAQRPESRVEIMDQRLRNVVAREPGEVIPIAQLIFHLAPLGLAVDQSVGPAQVITLNRHNLANLTPVHPLDRLAPPQMIAIGHARKHPRPVLFGQRVGFENLPDSGNIDRRRLLDEHVLPRPDGRQGVVRMEPGRTGDQDDVAILDHPPIPVQPGKPPFTRHLNPTREHRSQRAERSLDLVGKNIRSRPEHGARVAMHRVADRARAASAATNQSELEGGALGRVGEATHIECADKRCPSHCGRGLEKTAAVYGCRIGDWTVRLHVRVLLVNQCRAQSTTAVGSRQPFRSGCPRTQRGFRPPAALETSSPDI